VATVVAFAGSSSSIDGLRRAEGSKQRSLAATWSKCLYERLTISGVGSRLRTLIRAKPEEGSGMKMISRSFSAVGALAVAALVAAAPIPASASNLASASHNVYPLRADRPTQSSVLAATTVAAAPAPAGANDLEKASHGAYPPNAGAPTQPSVPAARPAAPAPAGDDDLENASHKVYPPGANTPQP
jgi:hypothetical protein